MKITKKSFFAGPVLLALVSMFFVGQANAAVYILSGDMDVFQATTNQNNVGSGSGTIAGDFDDVSNILNYTITWTDLTTPVSIMHFHVGAPGVPGLVDLLIPGPYTSPLSGVGIVLNPSQEANLLSGDWYVNIHTTQFGGGEIRGQVNVVPIPAAVWLFGSGLIGLIGVARRRKA